MTEHEHHHNRNLDACERLGRLQRACSADGLETMALAAVAEAERTLLATMGTATVRRHVHG